MGARSPPTGCTGIFVLEPNETRVYRGPAALRSRQVAVDACASGSALVWTATVELFPNLEARAAAITADQGPRAIGAADAPLRNRVQSDSAALTPLNGNAASGSAAPLAPLFSRDVRPGRNPGRRGGPRR